MANHADDNLGYAPAAGPLARETTIKTGSAGLTTRRLTIPSHGGDALPIYAAWPEAGGPARPVVLVVSEAFGLHEHIADVARRFAAQGYFAVAPDLMFRQGDPTTFADVSTLVRELLLKIPDGQVMGDLDACASWAAAQGGPVDRPLVVTGFCWGGRWTWLYAAHRAFAGAVAWYGILDGRASGLFPDEAGLFPGHPLDVARELKTPVLGLYGGQDEAISLATVAAMRERLATGHEPARRSEIVVYPDAGHAFFADYRESYRADAARSGWQRCLAFIGEAVRRAQPR